MEQVMTYWNFDLNALLLAAAFTLIYFLLSGFTLQKRAGIYFIGLLLLILVLASPLHFLGMHYLFSAHMIAHIIILLISAPLMIMGIPHKGLSRTGRVVTALSGFLNRYPATAWITGIGMMWFWHVPAVFDGTFPASHHAYSILPLLQTLSLLLGGMIFCWPLIGPVKALRINPLIGVIYLFTACMGCSLLGLLLTFAPTGIYMHYTMAEHGPLFHLVRDQWGITGAADQQAAGLIMWVPCCFLYLSASIYLFLKWLREESTAGTWTDVNVKLQEGK